MNSPKCSKCKSETRWLPGFDEMVTQTVERFVFTEDDGEIILEDQIYPVHYDVSECQNPECGELFLFDALGGLGDISRADYNERLHDARRHGR